MASTNLEGKLKEYIKHLYKAKEDIERKEDEKLCSSLLHPGPAMIPASTSECITLGVVIRDLEKIVYPKEFSYWNS